jgi:beta-fructofuranosidase
MEPQTLYRPRDGWVGDVIPFYRDGFFWLYYLHDVRALAGQRAGTDWRLVRTRDLIHFEGLGPVLPSGGPQSQDLNCYTGSIVRADERFHLFYTGYNPDILDEDDGFPLQAVMHAVGDDLITWIKLPQDTFFAPRGQYDRHDWRDPFVFRMADGLTWGMLLATRVQGATGRRGGCVGLLTSTDLRTWTPRPPFWAPGLWVTHECPDLFRIGDWWYLVTSEFSDRCVTRYRMGRSQDGPWLLPPDDTLDGRANYALKTASNGTHTYAFGWLATREGDSDDGPWQWAGSLLIHELVQNADGTLSVSMPEAVRRRFTAERSVELAPRVGDWAVAAGRAAVSVPDSYSDILGPAIDRPSLVSADITFEAGTRACGLLITNGDDPDDGYVLRLEPQAGRLVFDRWPRRPAGPLQWQIGGDIAHAVELERLVSLDPSRAHRLEAVIDGSACIGYLDGRVALSARIYGTGARRCGWFVSQGAAEVSAVSVRSMPDGASSNVQS